MKTTPILMSTLLALCGALPAADWPQWRGANRDGVAEKSPALLDAFPDVGPAKVWTSEEILGGSVGGYGSVAVSGGKACVVVNKSSTPPWRKLTPDILLSLGYDATLPPELVKLVDEARVSDTRKQAPNANMWVREWCKTNLKPEQLKWKALVTSRLTAGPAAIAWDQFAKLLPILDRKFDTDAALVEWLKTSGLDEADAKLTRQIMGRVQVAEDFVFCLDAATGKTLWKTVLDGVWFSFAGSATPSMVNGKCYVCNSEGRIYCLGLAEGNVLWKSDTMGDESFHHNRSSSVLLVDSVAVAISDKCLFGVDAQTGATLWKNNLFVNQQSSPAAWINDGKSWAIVNASGKLACINPHDGAVAWTAPCSGVATPTIFGQHAIVNAGGKNGVMLYKLSATGATLLWKTAMTPDEHASIVVSGEYAYYAGGAAGPFQPAAAGKASCLALKDGSMVWDNAPLAGAQFSSPLLADEKIIAVNGTELVVFKADPAKFTLLGKAELGLNKWSSPAIVDGKVFLRTPKNVICINLAKPN